MGASGSLGTDPETGGANNAIGQVWQGITGKRGPTAPQLPQGFGWLGPGLKDLFGGAQSHLNYGPADAAAGAGTIGAAGGAGLGAGVAGQLGGVNSTFGNALGGINEGIATGYMPDVSFVDSLLRPGLNRAFDEGSAGIREQNALTGNLSSSGASAQIGDYRAQLENNLSGQTAGILGQAIPTSMNIRAGSSALGAGLPGQLQGGLFGPLLEGGLAGQNWLTNLLGTATGGASGAPLYATQGSGGNGAVGSIASAYLGKPKAAGAG